MRMNEGDAATAALDVGPCTRVPAAQEKRAESGQGSAVRKESGAQKRPRVSDDLVGLNSASPEEERAAEVEQDLSAYEVDRLRNIKRNNDFLASLEIQSPQSSGRRVTSKSKRKAVSGAMVRRTLRSHQKSCDGRQDVGEGGAGAVLSRGIEDARVDAATEDTGKAVVGSGDSDEHAFLPGAVKSRKFVIGQEVGAWHRKGCWDQAVITDILPDSKFLIQWKDG